MMEKAHSTVHTPNSCFANSATENVYESHGRTSSVCSGCGERHILGSSACTQSESVEREPEDRFSGETPRSPTGDADVTCLRSFRIWQRVPSNGIPPHR